MWALPLLHDSTQAELRGSALLLLNAGTPSLRMFLCLLNLRILVNLVMYDSGKVSLEHLLLSWYPSQSSCVPTTLTFDLAFDCVLGVCLIVCVWVGA
jgi:hypothetical protein